MDKKRILRGRGNVNDKQGKSPSGRSKSDCVDVDDKNDPISSSTRKANKKNNMKQNNSFSAANNGKGKSPQTPVRNGGACPTSQPVETFRFEEHLSASEAERKIQLGELTYGVLRVSTAQYYEAYVPSQHNDADLLIHGVAARNRALNGDCVAVRVEPILHWKVVSYPYEIKAELSTHRNAIGETSAKTTDRTWYRVGEVWNIDKQYVRTLLGHLAPAGGDDELFQMLQGNSADCVDYNLIQRTGQVVAILHAVAPRVAVGFLRVPDMLRSRLVNAISIAEARGDARSSSDVLPEYKLIDPTSYAILSPRDTRMPRIRIGMRQLFEEHSQNCFINFLPKITSATQSTSTTQIKRTWDGMLFYARITDWSVDSQMPIGSIVRALGPLDDVNVRNAAILLENGVDHDEFDAAIVAPLKKFFGATRLTTSLDDGAVVPNLKNARPKAKTKTNVVLEQFCNATATEVPITSVVKSTNILDDMEVRISDDQLRLRRDFDFREEPNLCTIDPETARDLDDAVHCRLLLDESVTTDSNTKTALFEVGVHIADVSHFIDEKSALDDEAQRRATTVYLAERAIHMLPDVLSQQLASLTPGRDRLTFSVVWKLRLITNFDESRSVEIVDQRFGKSIINSCAQLSYEDAQALITDNSSSDRIARVAAKMKHGNIDDLQRSLMQLDTITKALHSKRMLDGALRINNPKLMFRLDPETALPTECSVYPRLDSHRLIEELMLLANTSVAQLLYRSKPSRAFLRRHPKPTTRQLANLASQCHHFGFALITPIASSSTSADLQQALAGIEKSLRRNAGSDIAAACMDEEVSSSPDHTADEENASFRIFLNVCSKVLPLAAYYCAGYQEDDIWASDHYALAMQHYCHFTSPIRRFADIVIHRQLAAVLAEKHKQQEEALAANSRKPTLRWHNEEAATIVSLQRMAELCNQRKRAARDIQDAQTSLYLGVFIKQRSPLRDQTCYVTALLDHALDLYVARFGIIRRCYQDKQKDLLKWVLKPVEVDSTDGTNKISDETTRSEVDSVTQQVARFDIGDDSASDNADTDSDDDLHDQATEINTTLNAGLSRTPMELMLIWRSDECTLHSGTKTLKNVNKKVEIVPEANSAGRDMCQCSQQFVRLLQPLKCALVNCAQLDECSAVVNQKTKKAVNERDPFEWTIIIEH